MKILNWFSLARIGQVVFGGVFLAFVLWCLLFIAAAIKQGYQKKQAQDQLMFDIAVAECRQGELMAAMNGDRNEFVKNMNNSAWHNAVKARCIATVEYKNSIRVKLGEFWQLTKDKAAYLVE